jgi:glutathionyl-hydroquinone reductase
MGYLLNGQWVDGNPPEEFGKSGAFERIDSRFRDRITADGSSGSRSRALSSLRGAQLSVGAPDHDLSRAQKA